MTSASWPDIKLMFYVLITSIVQMVAELCDDIQTPSEKKKFEKLKDTQALLKNRKSTRGKCLSELKGSGKKVPGPNFKFLIFAKKKSNLFFYSSLCPIYFW